MTLENHEGRKHNEMQHAVVSKKRSFPFHEFSEERKWLIMAWTVDSSLQVLPRHNRQNVFSRKTKSVCATSSFLHPILCSFYHLEIKHNNQRSSVNPNTSRMFMTLKAKFDCVHAHSTWCAMDSCCRGQVRKQNGQQGGKTLQMTCFVLLHWTSLQLVLLLRQLTTLTTVWLATSISLSFA